MGGEELIVHRPQMTYENTTAQGNSRNQYGNSYHTYNASVYHHSSPATPNVSEYVQDQNAQDVAVLREALAFDSMDDRFASIRTAHGETCQWLSEHKDYQLWRDPAHRLEHHGILWVKGKPGAGKSTLMKHAYTLGCRTFLDEVIIAFFFNARGEELQKSAVGLYRSLLNQLLDQLLIRIPQLPETLLALPSRRRRLKQHDWPVELLKDLFNDIILALGRVKLTCYIDALDECDEIEIRDMVEFLEDLGGSTLRAGIAFSAMFSSRHYPSISVGRSVKMVLDHDARHFQDIKEYVHSKLRMDDSVIADELASAILRNSNGVFLWVVLVVSKVNTEYDRGNRHLLLAHLRELPTNLHDLFQQIIQKGSYNRQNVLMLLQWVLFAKRPLALEECYQAVIKNEQGYSLSSGDPSDACANDMIRFITDTSRGLAEMSRGRAATVQFIHESVRDYLFGSGLRFLDPELTFVDYDTDAIIHERLYQCCYRHLLLYASLELCSPSDGTKDHLSKSLKKVHATRDQVLTRHPFMEYALDGLLHHAESMFRIRCTDSSFTPQTHSEICSKLHVFPCEIWSRLHNLIVKDPADRFGKDVSSEYIFAITGSFHLLDEATRDASQAGLWDRRMPDERYTCLLAAALSRNDQQIVNMLTAHGAKIHRK